ncbi:hypothetical protein [Paenibacillus sp. OSY-SE]|uniref:hypothetical protein n=1 Tax=Paenibacillus sp. OSY-SE TaxID=1196323 RepID=UPI0012FAE7C1|nr:hypothetical protein [Paenibacillus sp. OSY-SE]
MNDWILVRRYERRERIAVYDTVLVMATAGFFTLIVFGFGLLIHTIIKFLIYPNFPGYSAIFLYHPERTEQPAVILFIILFYLVMSSIGILYVLLKGLTNHSFIAAILVIALTVIDRFTLSVIPIMFTLGYQHFPFQLISALLLLMFMLIGIARVQLKYKDFL